jgi:hypothetical protein
MDQALISLYHRNVAAAFDRQMRLADFLEPEKVSDAPYRFRTSTATLEFGNTVQLVALDLGSHADIDSSWLWSWCNPAAALHRIHLLPSPHLLNHHLTIGGPALPG